MRTKKSFQNQVPQTTKYAWVAAATLIVALILGLFAGMAPVTGTSYAQEPAALPYTDVAKFYAERMRVQTSQTSALAANPELMFARRSYAPAASLLATNPELMLARRSYAAAASLLAANPLPYTDVAKFYAERMRVQTSQTSALASNPELMFARRSYGAAANMLAANPELMFARRSYGAAASMLAANPELMFARRAYDQGYPACSPDDDKLAANPELAFLRQAPDC